MSSPIIESFRLYGLHGYKDVLIEFPDSHRIIMAENGSGKTTVLSALAALLNSEFSTLQNLPFEELECKFVGDQEPIRIENSLLGDFYTSDELTEIANRCEIPVSQLRRWVTDNKPIDEIVERLWQFSPMSRREAHDAVAYLSEQMQSNLPDELRNIQARTADLMKSTNVLHLPTYRRIEAPLQKNKKPNRFKRALRHGMSLNSVVGVRYGLADVEERLSMLVAEIQRLSNQGYRQISAAIIDDLLRGDLELVSRDELPTIDSLSRFFSRIEQATNSVARTDRLSELYDKGDIDTGDNLYLKYFLWLYTGFATLKRRIETVYIEK